MTDMNDWWRDMTEAQKAFWYAARERDTAEALDRRLKAARWFMYPSIYMLFILWVWMIREVLGTHDWWGGWLVMVSLTLFVARGLWLYWVTYRVEARLDGQGAQKEYTRNRGVGEEDDPGKGDDWETRDQRPGSFGT